MIDNFVILEPEDQSELLEDATFTPTRKGIQKSMSAKGMNFLSNNSTYITQKSHVKQTKEEQPDMMME